MGKLTEFRNRFFEEMFGVDYKESKHRSREHLGDFMKNPRDVFRSDAHAVGRNLKTHHMKRMAAVMGLSGITMPIKAGLEVYGKGINSRIYNISPEIIQNVFDTVSNVVPDSMSWLVDFSTSGNEISDVASLISRASSLATSYIIADLAINGRQFAMKEFDLRKKGILREAGRMSVDFTSSLSLGPLLDYTRYGLSQIITNTVDASSRTNATLSVALPTAFLHMFRGYFLDIGCELVGYQKSERTPEWLAKKSPRFKKNLFYALMAGSALSTAGVYATNGTPSLEKPVIVETVGENNERFGRGEEYSSSCVNLEKKFNEEDFSERNPVRGLEYSL